MLGAFADCSWVKFLFIVEQSEPSRQDLSNITVLPGGSSMATKSCSNEEAETVDPDSVFTITQTHLQHLYGHLISLLQMMSCGTDAKNIWMAANHLSLVRNVGVAFTTTSKLEREVLFDAFVSCCGLGKSSSDGL